MRLAIFDLDNTLLAGDSDHAWGQFLVDRGLVDEHPGVGQGEPLAGGSRGEQDGRGGGRLAEAHGLDLGADVLHRVVDRRHRGERATG